MAPAPARRAVMVALLLSAAAPRRRGFARGATTPPSLPSKLGARSLTFRLDPARLRNSSAPLAICLAGQTRALVHEGVRQSWVRAFGARGMPDFFLQLGPDVTRKSLASTLDADRYRITPGMVEGDAIVNRSLSGAQLGAMLRWFEPRGLVSADVLSDKEVTAAERERLAGGRGRRAAAEDEPRARLPALWADNLTTLCPNAHGNYVRDSTRLRWARCRDAIEAAERARGAAYHYVLTARPDLNWPCLLPSFAKPAATGRHVLAANDYWWLAPRDTGLALLTAEGFSTVLSRRKPARERKHERHCRLKCNMRTQCFQDVVLARNGTAHDTCVRHFDRRGSELRPFRLPCGLEPRIVRWHKGGRCAADVKAGKFPELGCVSTHPGKTRCLETMAGLARVFA